MTPTEAALIFGAVKALCPAQKTEELSPDMWYRVLRRYPFKDAENAVIDLAETNRFIAPADIVGRLKQVRLARWEHVVPPCPNTVAGVTSPQEVRAIGRAICDGVLADQDACAAYERWGGSLHLVYERGQPLPELTGPAPVGTGPIELPPGMFQTVAPLTPRELAQGDR